MSLLWRLAAQTWNFSATTVSKKIARIGKFGPKPPLGSFAMQTLLHSGLLQGWLSLKDALFPRMLLHPHYDSSILPIFSPQDLLWGVASPTWRAISAMSQPSRRLYSIWKPVCTTLISWTINAATKLTLPPPASLVCLCGQMKNCVDRCG